MHTFAFTVQSGRQKQMFQAPDMTTHVVTATEEKERGLDSLSGVLTRSAVGGSGQTFLLRPNRCVGFSQDRCVKRQEAMGLRRADRQTVEARVAFSLAGGEQLQRSSVC